MLSPRAKNILAGLYVIVFVFGVLFVRSILSSQVVDTSQVSETEKVQEIHPAKVSVKVVGPEISKTYGLELRNVDTALDMLEEITKQGDFQYEKTEYTYGSELSMINGVRNTNSNSWRLILGETDITRELKTQRLADGQSYKIVYASTQD